MIGGKPDAFVVQEHAGPFLFRFVEKFLYRFLQLCRRVAVAEAQDGVVAPVVKHLVIEFGENELEYFFEHVHACVRENLVLHLEDQITQ